MIPQVLDGATCEGLCERWGISPELAVKLLVMSLSLRGNLSIRSGYRTREEQAQLDAAGRPTAPDDVSTHRSCPATGADLDWAGDRWDFGNAAHGAGLRWGGGGPVAATGMPLDWNHVDLGPRRS